MAVCSCAGHDPGPHFQGHAYWCACWCVPELYRKLPSAMKKRVDRYWKNRK